MHSRILNTSNKTLTPISGTTAYIDYSNEKQILEVAFRGGHIYQYFGVDIIAWQEYKQVIDSGGSSGKFVNSKIKPIYLSYQLVE